MRSDDGRIARDRVYDAIQGQSIESGQALWRAMGRYHWKYRGEHRDWNPMLATGHAQVFGARLGREG